MKKFFALFLVICIALVCFAACEEGSENSDDDRLSAVPSATSTKPENEDVVLKNEVSNQDSSLDNNKIEEVVYATSESEPKATSTPIASSSTDNDSTSDKIVSPVPTKGPSDGFKTPAPTKAPSYTFSQSAVGTPDIWNTPRPTYAPVATARPTATNRPVSTSTRFPSYETTPTAIITPKPTTGNGSVAKPENPGLDCIAMDFRGGNDACYDFSDGYFYLMTTMDSSHDCYLDPKDSKNGNYGYMNVEIEGSDPFFYMYHLGGKDNYPQSTEFNIQDYPIIKIVMKNGTSASDFEFFLFRQGYNCTDAERFTVSGVSKNDTSFKTYYIDLRASGASNTLSVSKGSASINRNFSAIRFDIPGTSGEVGIQYIGFFKTLADAQAYR